MHTLTEYTCASYPGKKIIYFFLTEFFKKITTDSETVLVGNAVGGFFFLFQLQLVCGGQGFCECPQDGIMASLAPRRTF